MIMPVLPPDPQVREARERLQRARRLVADALFGRHRPAEGAPRVRPWQAWLFAIWVLGVTAFYAAAMAGLL